MELLIVFVLGMVVYNFVFPILESITAWVAFKFTYLRGKDEFKIKEMEIKLFGDGESSNPIGFDMSSYSDEDFDEEYEEEEIEESDVNGRKTKKIGY